MLLFFFSFDVVSIDWFDGVVVVVYVCDKKGAGYARHRRWSRTLVAL